MYNNMMFLGMNILLNWTFVYGGPFRSWFGWEGFGFVGAAMSLSCSRSLQPLAYWLYMFVWRKAHVDTWPGWSWNFLKPERNRAFMAQSLPQVGTLILQATMNQSTTLMIAQLGPLAIASSSATTAITQIFTGGLTTTCTAITGIRVGFHLGRDHWRCAKRASVLVFCFSASAVVCIAAFLVPLRKQATSIITSDVEVQEVSSKLLVPVLLQTFAAMIVQCNVGGVFTSQGRTRLATLLSMGVELPMTLGIVAYLVFVVHTTVVPLYWGQAAVFWLEMAICFAIWYFSNWQQYADDAQRRQEATQASPSPLRSALCFSSPLANVDMLPSSPATALTGLPPNRPTEDQESLQV